MTDWWKHVDSLLVFPLSSIVLRWTFSFESDSKGFDVSLRSSDSGSKGSDLGLEIVSFESSLKGFDSGSGGFGSGDSSSMEFILMEVARAIVLGLPLIFGCSSLL